MIFKKNNNKGFSAIEIIIVISVIIIIASIYQITSKSMKKKALDAKRQANRVEAVLYCISHPGVSTLNEYVVYCDQYNNMWAPTLHSEMNNIYGPGTLNTTDYTIDPIYRYIRFKWAKKTGETEYDNNDIWEYTYGRVNDCNEVKSELMENFPACNACATLNYAGFSDGWRLAYATTMGKKLVEKHCHTDCGREDLPVFCAPGRQLWDYGAELCLEADWGADCEKSEFIVDRYCQPTWEEAIIPGDSPPFTPYWTATQAYIDTAWHVYFNNAYTSTFDKNSSYYVRCFLGEW